MSGRSAAALHQLDGFDEGPLEYLVPRESRRRRTVGVVHSTPAIDALDRCIVDDLPTTSGTRTVIELIGRVELRELGNAYDSACRRRLTAPSVIDRRLDELGRQGRSGIADLEQLMAMAGVESWLERRFLRLLRGHGLPMPSRQVGHEVGGLRVRVDFEFEPLPVVIEVGGARGYLSREERQRKERRRNELQLVGKTIYFFTTDDVCSQTGYVVRVLREAMRMCA